MTRKTIGLKLAALTLAGVAVLASPAAWAEKKGKAADKAEQGPSEQETVEFINGLLACEIRRERPVGAVELIETQTSSISIVNLFKLREEIKQDYYKNYVRAFGGQDINNIEVTLSNLDTEVEQSASDVKIRCNASRGSCISGERREAGGSKPISATDWTLNFCDADKAQRGAKAMKHLIEISGGKKSLF